jgi:hypothetical protein
MGMSTTFIQILQKSENFFLAIIDTVMADRLRQCYLDLITKLAYDAIARISSRPRGTIVPSCAVRMGPWKRLAVIFNSQQFSALMIKIF